MRWTGTSSGNREDTGGLSMDVDVKMIKKEALSVGKKPQKKGKKLATSSTTTSTSTSAKRTRSGSRFPECVFLSVYQRGPTNPIIPRGGA